MPTSRQDKKKRNLAITRASKVTRGYSANTAMNLRYWRTGLGGLYLYQGPQESQEIKKLMSILDSNHEINQQET